jgi:carboxyl-terminal processing protease
MKKQMLMVALAFAMSAHVVTAQPEKVQTNVVQLKPSPAQTQAALWASRVLARYHYKAVPLDDAMSAKIYDNYFKTLDSEKLYFTQADVDQFAPARTKFDDAINNEDLTLPFQIYNTYQQRFNDRMAYARELVQKGGFDFNANETLQIDREKAPWAKNEDEARDLWRKRVKNDWLRLKLAGKDDKGIRDTLDKRYEGYQSRLKKLNNEDVFQMFMNAYATAIEPHTNYLGPRSAENFDIMMRLSLDGIGAVLQSRDDYTVIREVVAGGPADKSGKLKVGDRIVGVAQGNGAFTDVMGWRIDDVVQLVRGERNSTVRLDVLPADAGQDGKHVTIPLVRQKISMEEQSAKKQIIEVKDGGVKRRIGVISLPTFYQDFEARRKGDKDFKSATRDVQRILGELKKDKVDNVLIDLRNNGGGSLIEAVELTGLFIDKGPVVQQRTAEGRVQTLIPLDRFSQSDKVKYGELKMTIAQFFRINGGTTQLRGVTPDIKLPVTSDAENFGESSYDNALPWVQIKPATFLPSGDLKELVNPLQKRHDVRVAKDKEFRDIEADIAEALKLRKENVISLNEAVRRKERENQEAKARLRESRIADESGKADEPVAGPGSKEQRAKAPNPTAPKKNNVAMKGAPKSDDGLQGDERSLAAEIAAEKAAKNAKDVYLQEAAHILADEIGMLKSDTRMASRTMPYFSAMKQNGN